MWIVNRSFLRMRARSIATGRLGRNPKMKKGIPGHSVEAGLAICKQLDIDPARIVVMRIEPARRLSMLCGFPYFIERRFTVKELLENKVIDENDVNEMEQGKEIQKHLPVVKGHKTLPSKE